MKDNHKNAAFPAAALPSHQEAVNSTDDTDHGGVSDHF
jgi:hypothetical protein